MTNKRILICPLDWGLGHATRCIPIIRLLMMKKAEVIIASDGRALQLLKREFPTLEFIQFKGYEINYPDSGSMVWKMLFSIPKILRGIRKEHTYLKRIIKYKNIDIVISDNRFGLWNKDIKTIFITHQLIIKSPFAENILHKINLYYVNKYNECWIPDVEDEPNLSGDLSHKYSLPKNAFFIGALSRFDKNIEDNKSEYKHTVLGILSGPEPQRSILEKLITEQLITNNISALIVCGKTEEIYSERMIGKVKIVPYINSSEIKEAIIQSKIIVARSGYSTIMDLSALCKNAIFIPTPGQTEQEYLAKTLQKKGIANYQTQKEFDIKKALSESEKYSGFKPTGINNILEKRIDQLLK